MLAGEISQAYVAIAASNRARRMRNAHPRYITRQASQQKWPSARIPAAWAPVNQTRRIARELCTGRPEFSRNPHKSYLSDLGLAQSSGGGC